MVYRSPAAITLTADDLIKIGLDKGLTLASFEEAIRNHSPSSSNEDSSPSGGDVLKVTVDYSQTKDQMIALGHYDFVNDYLRNKDPVEGKIDGSGVVPVTLELLNFDRVISPKDALKEIKKRGLTPAKIEHLLALGAKYPDLQKEFPIVALGSVWRDPDGGRYVPCLWDDDGGRDLDLYWIEGDWDGYYRFLVVRK